MFGLHQDGAETDDGGGGIVRPDVGGKEAGGEMGEGEVEVEFGGGVEDGLGTAGGLCDRGGSYGPEDDIELGSKAGGDEAGVCGEALGELEGGVAAGVQIL